MLRARREGVLLALLVVMTAWLPLGAAAQEPEEPPAERPPPVGEPPPAEDAPVEEPEASPDPDDDEWITEDVAGETDEDEQEAEPEKAEPGKVESSEGDVDEVIIEYDDSGEADKVTDAAGREIEDIPTPVVSKAVKVQDPDDLEPGADKETGVQGQVVSRRPKKVLPDAPVLAKGKDDGRLRSTLTDDRGRYRLYLPPGKYTLRSYYDLYHGARWDNIAVTRGAFKRVNFVLDPISEKDAGVEEQEIVYMAQTDSEAAQLALRKEAIAVQDSISSEEISRAGDSTAQGAVKRVVGVTVEGGRVIIRGLGGRYNRILVNGMPVPGVDPDIPSVKLDIFPTDIVSSLAVVKTPRPDLPGNFAGGLLLIETSSYPQELSLKAGVSFGVNSLSTFKQMPSYQGGKLDWLGYDDGTRGIPRTVGNDRLRLASDGRYQSREQVAQVGREFPNIWNPQNRTALPKMGLKFSAGNTYDLRKRDNRAGFQVSFLYDYQDKIRNGFNRRYVFDENGDTVREQENFDFNKGVQEVLWGTFGAGFVEIGQDHLLNLTTFFSRSGEDTTLLQLGEDQVNSILTTKNSYDFIGRSIFFNQLQGDHRNLGDSEARLRWNAVVSNGKREQPDRREIVQQVESQNIITASRFNADLDQLSTAGKTSIRFPMFKAFDGRGYGTVGMNGGYEQRDFLVRRFNMRPFRGGTVVGDPEFAYGPDGLGRVSTIEETTLNNDSYDASNTSVGGFVQLETPMTKWLRFLGLMQFQVFRQQVESQSPFGDTAAGEVEGTDRTDVDPLPSANFAFAINDKMSVKLGYGMTVIRPALRELAPFLYQDFLRGWIISGNPELQRTRVQNAEARYEYFFGQTDLIAATAFFKHFREPIEFVVFSPTNNTAGFANADTAWLAGGEIELRLGFGIFTEKLRKLFFQGNVAVAWSETTLPSDQLNAGRAKRPLFYQSRYVTNMSLRFDDPDSGVMTGLVYNAFGPRLVEVGTTLGNVENPDVIELSQHRLDFIVSYKPTDHVKLGLKWKNITFAKKRYQQGGELVLLENYGTSISIGAEYIY
jgi:hypothetical protein